MKVIHLPVNISSQISTTVRALQLAGVHARGLARNFSPIQTHSAIEVIDWFGPLNPVARLWRGLRWRSKLTRAIAWADVVHWHWGDTTWKGFDLRLAASMKKARLVEFWGDDLREPKRAARDNPFLERLYQQYPETANLRSTAIQSMFSERGFSCLIPGYELADYLDPRVFPGYYQTRPRLLLADYVPAYPDANRRRPLLVHAPSDKAKKGTETVLAAVKALQQSHDLDFTLIHQMPRGQALATVASADIFLDQFTIGAEGLAALEAMALGKPVVCFIKQSLLSRYPDSLPVVVADQGNLSQVLQPLLASGSKRRELGMRSRKYVEAYHDARALAAELVEIYSDLSSQSGHEARTGAARCSQWRVLQAQKGVAACAV